MRTCGYMSCNCCSISGALIPAAAVSITAKSTGRCCARHWSSAARPLEAVTTTNPAFCNVAVTCFKAAPRSSPTTTMVLSESSTSILPMITVCLVSPSSAAGFPRVISSVRPSGQPVFTAWRSWRTSFLRIGGRRSPVDEGIGLLFGHRLAGRFGLLSFSNG